MEVSRGNGVFNVTIKRLKKADAGVYHCKVEENVKVLYQEVNLKVLDGKFLVKTILDLFIDFTADIRNIKKQLRIGHLE